MMQWLARPLGPMVSGRPYKNGIHIAVMETETISGLSEIQTAAIWEASLSLAFRVSGGNARSLRVSRLQPTYLIKKLDRRPLLRSAGRSYCDPAALHYFCHGGFPLNRSLLIWLPWWQSQTMSSVDLICHYYLICIWIVSLGELSFIWELHKHVFMFIAEHCVLSVGLPTQCKGKAVSRKGPRFWFPWTSNMTDLEQCFLTVLCSPTATSVRHSMHSLQPNQKCAPYTG